MTYVWFTEETAKLVPADVVAEVEAAFLAVNDACRTAQWAASAAGRSRTKANLAAYQKADEAHVAALAIWHPIQDKLIEYYEMQNAINQAEYDRIAEGPETIELFGDNSSPIKYRT
jgi:hypothetical protein